MENIKMETKSSEPIKINPSAGLQTPSIRTGQLNNKGPELKVSSIGMEKHLVDAKPKKANLIEIDVIQLDKLITLCVEDLKNPRLFTIDGKQETIIFVDKYDDRNKIILFNYDINKINKMLNTNEETLSDFFSSFFYTNLNNYSLSEFKGIPSILPLMTIDTASEKGIKIIYH